MTIFKRTSNSKAKGKSDKMSLARSIGSLIGSFKFKRFILFFILVVIVLPLSYKIKEKKEALLLSQSQDQDKDKAQGTEKALSNVITFTPKPSPIREKISFPGMEELSQW